MSGERPEADQPSTPRSEEADGAATLGLGFCGDCGYALRGLPEEGMCPECGAVYSRATVWRAPPPSTFSLVLRMGWPVALLAAFGIVVPTMVAPGDPLGSAFLLGCISPVIMLVILINTFLQIQLLASDRLPERDRFSWNPFRNAGRLGTTAVIMLTVSLVSIFIFFGGCLLLIA